MKKTTAPAMAPWFERWCHLMMYLLIKGKKVGNIFNQSLDMI
jgi:hypothetical protein